MNNLVKLVFCLLMSFWLIDAATALEGDYDPLVASLEEIRLQANISGVAVMITSSRSELFAKALGHRSHEAKTQLSLDHYIRLGSVSKLFTAMAALNLETSTEFSISRPVSDFVSEVPFNNPWKSNFPLTVANLLEHTAGFTDLTRKEFAHNQAIPLEQAFLVDPSSRIVRWPPGHHSSYSNSGAGIAAYVIESVSRTRFEDYVSKQIFGPMKMKSATYFLNSEVKLNLIKGYQRDGTTPIPYWHTLYRAFGAINIKTREMSQVLQVLMSAGQLKGEQIFPQAMISRMETPRTSLAAKDGLVYGYGLGLYHFNHRGIPFIGHGGDADGYLSYLGYSRHLDRGYFITANAYNNRAFRKMRRVIEDSLVKDAERRGIRPPQVPDIYEMDADDKRQFVGEYKTVTYRFGTQTPDESLHVTLSNGELFTKFDGQKERLLPVSNRHFRRHGEALATIAIVKKGEFYFLQGDIGNFKR